MMVIWPFRNHSMCVLQCTAPPNAIQHTRLLRAITHLTSHQIFLTADEAYSDWQTFSLNP